MSTLRNQVLLGGSVVQLSEILLKPSFIGGVGFRAKFKDPPKRKFY